MKRSDNKSPLLGMNPLCEALNKAWESGWLDEYSSEHFLIRAMENRLESFLAEVQHVNNSLNQFNFVSPEGQIDYESFGLNFCINLSNKLRALENKFGEEPIKEFIKNQMAAGKENYDEDQFFEVLSEVDILSFFSILRRWKSFHYEPQNLKKEGKHTNPEASFESDDAILNVEVKSPKFPEFENKTKKMLIPTVLLTDNGKETLNAYCKENNIAYKDPRVLKIVDFLNSASSKFDFPKKHEYNILFINWSYRDFAANSYLEAWSLLTNEYNGLLIKPEKFSNKDKDLNMEFMEKISAIVVYTEDIDLLAFNDFRYVWVSNNQGPHFRFWVNKKICKCGDIKRICKTTGMKPSRPITCKMMADFGTKNAETCYQATKIIEEIIEPNILK